MEIAAMLSMNRCSPIHSCPFVPFLRSDFEPRLVEIDGCKLEKLNLDAVKGRVAGDDGSQIYVTVLRREGVKPDVAVTHPYRKQDAKRIMVESMKPVQGGIRPRLMFAVQNISNRVKEPVPHRRILCSPELKLCGTVLCGACVFCLVF